MASTKFRNSPSNAKASDFAKASLEQPADKKSRIAGAAQLVADIVSGKAKPIPHKEAMAHINERLDAIPSQRYAQSA